MNRAYYFTFSSICGMRKNQKKGEIELLFYTRRRRQNWELRDQNLEQEEEKTHAKDGWFDERPL